MLEDLWAVAGIRPVGGRRPAEIVHRLAERAAAARAPRLSEAEAGLVQRYHAVSAPAHAALDAIAALARDGGLNLDAPLAAWSARLDSLAAQGAPRDRLTLATGFGRSFSYYDGFLFEVRSAALDEDEPVAAGGRYDGLAAALGGTAGERAVGCMVRPGQGLGRRGGLRMTAPLTIGLPSKGRLKEQAEAWLADCGFKLEVDGGARGYRARLSNLPEVEVQLVSAGDIAAALDVGDLHLGVTGEDLLRERGDGLGSRVMLLRALGFGRADLVVAAPQSWIDVETMADLDEVAAAYVARTGRRLRVATKYMVQTRAFFARAGIADYRIIESSGATEGAPAAGAAELIVDITTTGATLAANGLRPLADGLILKSQAQLAASLSAAWTPTQLAAVRRLMGAVEARARAVRLALLSWPAEQDSRAEAATDAFLSRGATRRASGLLAEATDLLDVAAALAEARVGPVSVTHPEFAFEPFHCPAANSLKAAAISRRPSA